MMLLMADPMLVDDQVFMVSKEKPTEVDKVDIASDNELL